MAKSEIDRLLAKYPGPRDVRYAPQLEGRGSELKNQFPGTYGFLGGLMGTVPDEFERGSVLSDEERARDTAVTRGAEYGYPLGVLANAAPLLSGIGGLAAKYGPGIAKAVAKNAATPATLSKQAGVIKAPGGNWLSGSVEDALKGLKAKRGDLDGRPDATFHPYPEDVALNNWIDKQLTRYVKNDMATERDPVRALAERGVLHVDPTDYYLAEKRVHPSGEALEKLGKSPWAARWENISDNVLRNEPAGDLLADRMMSTGENPHLKQNPWLAKVPPETKVSRVDRGYDVTQDLGFSHLIDELRNATNPASGLPADLLLKYDALDKVSVPQAVERVAKINEWRAAQKAEADLARANNAATVLHKEYPEAGMKWVELKAPEQKLPEGYTVEKADGLLGSYAVKGGGDAWHADSEQEAIARFFRHRPEFTDKSLKDALKYEGDTMGHCVGGYCDDVASGASRIYSLRDAKGRPHVTVEVRPTKGRDKYYTDWVRAQPEEVQDQITAAAIERQASEPRLGYGEALNAVLKSKLGSVPDEIIQIKGKGNKKPNDEYLPFVQDFVKSGKWSDVGDFGNTGLVRASGLPVKERHLFPQDKQFITEQEMNEIRDAELARALGRPPGFAKGGAVKAPHPCGCDKGYASGGLVQYDPDRINSLVDQLRAEFA